MSQNNENGVIIRDLSPFQAALIRENVVIARQKRDKTGRMGEFMRTDTQKRRSIKSVPRYFQAA